MKAIVTALLTVLAWSASVAGGSGPVTKRDNVFSGDISIPTFDGPLPLFSLHDQIVFPSDTLQGILKSVAPVAKLNQVSLNQSSLVYDGDRLVAFYDNSTGQT